MAEAIPAESHEVGTAVELAKEPTAVEVHRQSFNPEQLDLIKRTICAGGTDDELALFVKVAERTGLDPFARQIHAVKRWSNEARREVMSIQVGIDGFRLIADRTHRYRGRLGPYWCDGDGEWLMDSEGRPKPWLRDYPPSAAMVGVRHSAYAEPLWAVATWRSYVQTKKDGNPMIMWATKGDLMLAKCAEALALRGAFPAELSGLYTDDEMGQASNPVGVEPQRPGTPSVQAEQSVEQKLGWADATACKAAHDAVIAQIKALPPEADRSSLSAHRAAKGMPMSPDDLSTLAALVDKAKPSASHGDGPDPDPPRNQPEDAAPVPEAPSASGGQPEGWDGLTCPRCEKPVTAQGSVILGGKGPDDPPVRYHKDCYKAKRDEENPAPEEQG